MFRELIPFQKRLNRQARLRAGMLALLCGVLAGDAVLLGYRLFTDRCFPPAFVIAAAVTAIAGFLLFYFAVFRFGMQKTAAYLDAAGLQERVMTMLLLAGQDDPVSRLQREDTLRRVRAADPRSIPTALPKRTLSALVAAMIVCAVLFAVPGPYLPRGAQDDAALLRSQEAQLVDQLLEEMRRRIEESSLSEERRQELLAWLEQMAGSGEIDMKQLADLIAASQALDERISNEESYGAVISEMLAQPHFTALAKAILSVDIDAMYAFFDAMEDSLSQLAHEPLLEELLTIRAEALAINARAVEDEGDTTVTGAFTQLASGFYLAAVGGFSHEDTLQLVHEDLYQCRLTILAMLQAMSSASSDPSKDSEGGSSDVSSRQDTHEEQGTAAGKTEQDENGLIGGGTEGIASESFGSAVRTDSGDALIWDAEKKQQLPYREVYGKYYLQLLDGMESGLWNEDTYQEISTYFDGL